MLNEIRAAAVDTAARQGEWGNTEKGETMSGRGYFVLIGMAIMMQLGPAYAAGPFDGPWSGSVNSMGSTTRAMSPCPVFEGKARMFIQDGTVVRGQVITPKGTPPIHGTVADDGTFTGTVGKAAMTGKIAGDTFTGRWAVAPVCPVNVNMSRTH
jgi:hypothetical protein